MSIAGLLIAILLVVLILIVLQRFAGLDPTLMAVVAIVLLILVVLVFFRGDRLLGDAAVRWLVGVS